jgi:hypothetical protein
MDPDGIQGIHRAGRVVAAAAWQQRGNEVFVKIYQDNERIG